MSKILSFVYDGSSFPSDTYKIWKRDILLNLSLGNYPVMGSVITSQDDMGDWPLWWMPTVLTFQISLVYLSVSQELQNVKRLCWHRKANLTITVISCGQHLNCCVWQLDISTELRKLTSTASLSSYRRSCSERSRTFWPRTLRRVSAVPFHVFVARRLMSVWLWHRYLRQETFTDRSPFYENEIASHSQFIQFKLCCVVH